MNAGSPIWKGGLAHTDVKSGEDFTVGRDATYDLMLYRYEVLSLIAYHLALKDTGLIGDGLSDRTVKALRQVYGEEPRSLGGAEDVHTLVENMVSSIDAECGAVLRTLLSRNEQVHTDLRLFFVDHLLSASLVAADACIRVMGTRGEDGDMPGYTHYRQAMPVKFSTYMDYVSRTLLSISERSLALADMLSECPLGYGSGFGSLSPVDRGSLAGMLCMRPGSENPLHMASLRGLDEIQVLDLVKDAFISMSRIAQDLIMWSSEEIGILRLPDDFVTGSSLMPNKRNPDFLEMVQGYASMVTSMAFGASADLLSKSTGYHRDFQVPKWHAMEALLLLERAIPLFGDLISRVQFDPQRARELVLNSTHATSYASSLVLGGMPWKEAYRSVGSMLAGGKRIPESPAPAFRPLDGHEVSSHRDMVSKKIEERKRRLSGLLGNV
ncbi:lyase family protein [Thermogymnomonas acidicola]|nr:lyase family protein [Thermogymnomonas acidicola]